MLVERREQAIAIWIGSTGNGRNPIVNGRRQPSCDGTSRMNREVHVRICERLGVKRPGPTRHSRLGGASWRSSHVRNAPLSTVGPKKAACRDGPIPDSCTATMFVRSLSRCPDAKRRQISNAIYDICERFIVRLASDTVMQIRLVGMN